MDINKCAYCGAQMQPGKEFCPECGKKAETQKPVGSMPENIPDNLKCAACGKAMMEMRILAEVSHNTYTSGNKQITEERINRTLTGGICADCFDAYIEKNKRTTGKIIGTLAAGLVLCGVGVLFFVLAEKIGWKLFGLLPIIGAVALCVTDIRDAVHRAEKMTANTPQQNFDEFYGEAVERAFVKKAPAMKYVELCAKNAATPAGELQKKYGVMEGIANNIVILSIQTEMEKQKVAQAVAAAIINSSGPDAPKE